MIPSPRCTRTFQRSWVCARRCGAILCQTQWWRCWKSFTAWTTLFSQIPFRRCLCTNLRTMEKVKTVPCARRFPLTPLLQRFYQEKCLQNAQHFCAQAMQSTQALSVFVYYVYAGTFRLYFCKSWLAYANFTIQWLFGSTMHEPSWFLQPGFKISFHFFIRLWAVGLFKVFLPKFQQVPQHS